MPIRPPSRSTIPCGVGLAILLAVRAPAQADPATPADPDHHGSATPPAADASAPGGLLDIANREATRSAKALRDRILATLRKWTLQHELAADRGKEMIDSVVNFGPDAVPVLLGFVKAAAEGKGEESVVQPAARALVGLADRTQKPQVVKELAEAVKGATAQIRIDVLAALEAVDSKVVVDFAGPMLDDENPLLRIAAVRALGRQASHAGEVSKLLRPQMQKEKGPWVDTLRSLHELKDKSSVDLAQTVLSSSQDAQLVGVALRYVADYGGKGALPALEVLLDANRPSSFDDSLLKQAVDAVQQIGLREIDAKRRAEEILALCMKSHPNVNVRDRALWQLGPYQNAEALKRLEEPLMKDIDANRKSSPSRSNANNFVSLGESRLRFEAWSKAIEALNKAKEEDDKQFRASYIERLRAVANCGLDKFEPARKALEKFATPEERVELLATYPVLEKMAKDPKYHDLFSGK